MSEKGIPEILQLAVNQDASDVHFVGEAPPVFRIHGEMLPSDLPIVTNDNLEKMIFGMLTDKQKSVFSEFRELDFSYGGLEGYQCRFNIYLEKGHLAAVVRIAPTEIKNILRFELPSIMKKLARKRNGLVVVSGTAGSGKSTTMTYMVDLINQERKAKIITIEDPIEYVHQNKKSLVVQREVGSDTLTFANALKYALRQDPDVVVIGEMRDFESMSMALTTAETGHLVISTVHAPDTIETINRIIDVYPIGYKDQICAQLAGNLLGIINQTLVPRKGTNERVLATEVLMTSISIRNLIRRGAFTEIRAQLDSEEDDDIHTLEKSLSNLVKEKVISVETARTYAKHPNLLDFSEPTNFRKTATLDTSAAKGEESQSEAQDETILIIDPSVSDQENMTSVLKSKGYTHFSYARNGEEGIVKFEASYPHIVIVDKGIFDIDSFEICKTIKGLKGNDVKVIMITDNLKPTDQEEAEKAGADSFVIKTKAYELLMKSLNNLKENA